LPEPWENYDHEVDISRPLPFDSETAELIFAEHVIEHVPYLDGMCFLSECKRLLAAGGVLRLAFPDVTRIVTQAQAETMANYIRERRVQQAARTDLEQRARAYRFIMLGSGHRACWTRDTATAAALAVGFVAVDAPNYGESFASPYLRGIDGHHLTSSVAELETTVLELRK
jgi:SAM-dependent methyltransferase